MKIVLLPFLLLLFSHSECQKIYKSIDYSGVDSPPDSLLLKVSQAKSLLNKSTYIIMDSLSKKKYPFKDSSKIVGLDSTFAVPINGFEDLEKFAFTLDSGVKPNVFFPTFSLSRWPTLQNNAYVMPWNLKPETHYEKISRRAKSLLPSIWNLKEFLPYIGDQGDVWSCTAWAAASMISIDSSFKLKKKFKVKTDISFFPSPSYIYQMTKEKFNPENRNTCSKGIDLVCALDILLNNGAPALNQCAYYKPTSVCPPQDLSKYVTEASKNKIKGFSSVNMNVIDFQDAISHNCAIMIQTYVDNDFFSTGSNGKWSDKNPYVWNSFRASADNTERPKHTMLCVGYSDAIGAFELVNSKGSGFGENGFFWVTYDFLFKTITQAFRLSPDNYTLKTNEEERIIKNFNRDFTKIISQGKILLKQGESKTAAGLQISFIDYEIINGADPIIHLQVIDRNHYGRKDVPVSINVCKYITIAKDIYLFEVQKTNSTGSSHPIIESVELQITKRINTNN